jgi:hypothetical protein
MKKQHTFIAELQCTLRLKRTLEVGTGSKAEIELAQAQFDKLMNQPGVSLEVIPMYGGARREAIIAEDGTTVKYTSELN